LAAAAAAAAAAVTVPEDYKRNEHL